MTIAVTGGNGEFGSSVIAHLSAIARQPIVATVRDVSKARDIAGVDYRPGDFDDPAALCESLSGIDTVLVNATFFGADPSRRLPRVKSALTAGAEARVRRIVLTSWPDMENAAMPSVQNYRDIEAALKTAGPSWTVLRMSVNLADVLARDVVWGRKTGELVAPARDASAAPAALEDLAEAAAIVLAVDEHENEVVELTGPDALRWTDLARMAGAPFRAVSDQEYTAYLSDVFKFPEDTAQLLTSLYTDFRSGWAPPTTTLAGLLGRPPVPGIEAVSRRAVLFPAQ